jgi:hypothetical protein
MLIFVVRSPLASFIKHSNYKMIWIYQIEALFCVSFYVGLNVAFSISSLTFL